MRRHSGPELLDIEEARARRSDSSGLILLRLASAMVQSAREGFLVADDTGSFVFANPVASELLGRSIDDILQLRVDALRALDGKGGPSGHLGVALPDGTRRRVQYRIAASIAPGLDLWTLEDVTESERLKTELAAAGEAAENERRLRAVLDDAADTAATFTPVFSEDGRFVDIEATYLNHVALDRWYNGLPFEAVRGRRIFAEFPSIRDLLFDIYRDVVETGREFRGIRAFPHENGDIIGDLRVSLFPGGIAHLSRDVTPIIAKALAALHRSEALYRDIVETMHEGVVVHGPDGSVVASNPRASEILGVATDELTGLTSFDPRWQSTHPDGTPMPGEEHPAVITLRTGKPCRNVLMNMAHPDGRRITISINSALMPHAEGEAPSAIVVFADVTEREEAQRALAESEERYRLLAENAADVVFRSGLDGRAEWISESLTALTGWLPEHVMGRDFRDFIHPDDVQALLEARQASVGGQAQRFEARVRTVAGGYHWVSILMRPVLDETGTVVARAGGWRDIEQEVRARELLERRDAELLEAQRIAQIGSWTMSVGSDRIEASEGLYRLFGLDPAGEFPAYRDEGLLFTPESAASLYAARARAMETGAPYELPVEIVRRDGEHRYAVARGEAVHDSAGQLRGLRGTIIDMTRVVRAAHETESLRAELNEAQRVARVGSWLLYPGPDGRFADSRNPRDWWSPTMFAIHGANPAEPLPGLGDYLACLPQEDAPLMRSTVEQCLADGGYHQHEHRFRRPDGQYRIMTVRASGVLNEAGEVVAIRGTTQDVTEERGLELRLRQAERLETVGQLAGGVAHDFNNLLIAIRSFAGFALDSLPPDHPARADIDEVIRTADRATGLTRQLLLFSRRVPAHPQVIEPAAVVEALAPMLRRLVGEHVEIVVTRGKAAWVSMDPTQLEQLIVNLAVNARDAMPDGGRLAIDIHLAGEWVELTVSDTGVGMSPETQARLFEPFYTTKEAGRGTGLGLATVHGIVEQAAGRIGVTSEPGRGTSFLVQLPCVPAPAEEAEEPVPASAAAGAGCAVLLVEDDPFVREVIGRMLRNAGHTVFDAAGPEAALALPDDILGAIDLLMTDVVMPGMLGPKLATELRARRPGLKTLLISGVSPESLAVEHPDMPLLHKPFTPPELSEALRAVLARD